MLLPQIATLHFVSDKSTSQGKDVTNPRRRIRRDENAMPKYEKTCKTGATSSQLNVPTRPRTSDTAPKPLGTMPHS